MKKIYRWLKIIIIIYLALGIAFYFLQDKFLFHPMPIPADSSYRFTKPFHEINIIIIFVNNYLKEIIYIKQIEEFVNSEYSN